jgi:hypothetical protein
VEWKGAIEAAASDKIGTEAAAGAVFRFEDLERNAARSQALTAGEPGQPSADDQDISVRCHAPSL